MNYRPPAKPGINNRIVYSERQPFNQRIQSALFTLLSYPGGHYPKLVRCGKLKEIWPRMTETPPSRRKACQECVKAKRKCGMELPRCRRCQKKNITCAYPNTRTSVADLQIPELEFPWLDDLMREGTLPWSGGLQPQLATASQLPTPFDPGSGSSGDSYVVPEYLASEGSSKTTMPRSAMNAAIHRFKSKYNANRCEIPD